MNTLTIKGAQQFTTKCHCGTNFTFSLHKGYLNQKDAMKCPSCSVVFTCKMTLWNYIIMSFIKPTITIVEQKKVVKRKGIFDIIGKHTQKFKKSI